jgi:hypothetical protein
MLKNVMALVMACVALSACALPSGPMVSASAGLPPSPAAVPRSIGALNIEPFEIVFSHRKAAQPQPVRVWQRGYRGHYVVNDGCMGVVVVLQKYTQHNASLWSVRPIRMRPERCTVKFSGTRGPRGTNYLQINILR